MAGQCALPIPTTVIFPMLLERPRRNRKTAAIRSLVAETTLQADDLILPLFLIEGENTREKITLMPGIHRLSIDLALLEIEELQKKGLVAVALFPHIDPSLKDDRGTYALQKEGLIPRAIRAIKQKLPTICVISDIALDPFTAHGHDGIVLGNDVDNEMTVEVLQKMACIHAECGADMVAPSDMMDGRILRIREALDQKGFLQTGILAYSAKYASSLYAPFREAVGSSLRFGDKKTYQMNPANRKEALREALLDEKEGADILMVKPALFYLDVIQTLKAHTTLPICAYHVSGEYAMVIAAEERGMLNGDAVLYESLLSIKRAGADCIITYATKRLLDSNLWPQKSL